jgi:translation initiation factor 2 alpha subunit (eIF-2alpha)
MKVTATVQLVKDYGLIVAIEKYADLTGFVVNEQKLSPDKQYKEGQKLDCIVLDCDTEKAIVDLSERLSTSKQSEESSKKSAQKAFVEVVKDQYLVVTLKSNRSKVVACILHPFNLERTAAELY